MKVIKFVDIYPGCIEVDPCVHYVNITLVDDTKINVPLNIDYDICMISKSMKYNNFVHTNKVSHMTIYKTLHEDTVYFSKHEILIETISKFIGKDAHVEQTCETWSETEYASARSRIILKLYQTDDWRKVVKSMDISDICDGETPCKHDVDIILIDNTIISIILTINDDNVIIAKMGYDTSTIKHVDDQYDLCLFD